MKKKNELTERIGKSQKTVIISKDFNRNNSQDDDRQEKYEVEYPITEPVDGNGYFRQELNVLEAVHSFGA